MNCCRKNKRRRNCENTNKEVYVSSNGEPSAIENNTPESESDTPENICASKTPSTNVNTKTLETGIMEDFDLSTVGEVQTIKTSEPERSFGVVNETVLCEAKKIRKGLQVKVKKPNFPKGIFKNGKNMKNEKNKGKRDDEEENDSCVEKLDDCIMQDLGEKKNKENKKKEKNKGMKDDEENADIGGDKRDKKEIKHKGCITKTQDKVRNLRKRKLKTKGDKIEKEKETLNWTQKLKATLLKNKKKKDSCDEKLNGGKMQELGESCHALVDTRKTSKKGEDKKKNCEGEMNNYSGKTFNTDISGVVSDKVREENYTKAILDIVKPGDGETEKEKDKKKKRKTLKLLQRVKTKKEGREDKGINGYLDEKHGIIEKKNKKDKYSCKDKVNKKDIIKKEGKKISKKKITFKKVRFGYNQLQVVDNVSDGRVNCNDIVENMKKSNKESDNNKDVPSINERLI